MAVYRIEATDGSQFDIEGPEDATERELSAFAEQAFSQKPERSLADYRALNQPEEVDATGSFLENLGAGAGKAFYDVARGAEQLVTPDKNDMASLVSGDKRSDIQREIDDARQLERQLMETGGGVTGNILGNIAITAPLMAIPGVNTIKGSAMLGGALGASQPVATGQSRAANAGLGALGGAAGGALNKGLARVVRPNTSPQVSKLIKEGTVLTPGQILGGAAKSAEDKLASVPILGDAITHAQRRSVESFNKSALDRALAPIGQKASGIGREGIIDVQQKLSDAYGKLLPNLKFAADRQFADDLLKLQQMASQLPPAQAAQFEKVFRQQLIGKMTPNGLMNGESYKEVESQLLSMAKGYAGDADFDKRNLGAAIGELVNSMKATLARSNPAHADQLKRINEGWANYARLRGAASGQGAAEGVFTPAQLSSAVKAQDKSVGKGSFAQGKALMQDLSDAGKTVIGSKYPDSGTAGRMLLGIGGLGAGAIHPGIPLGLLGGAAAYGPRISGRAMQAILSQRPDKAVALAKALMKAGPATAVAGSELAQP